MVRSSAGRSATRRARMFGRSGISSKRNFGAVRRRYGGRGTRAYPFSSVHTTPLRNRSAIELQHPRGRFSPGRRTDQQSELRTVGSLLFTRLGGGGSGSVLTVPRSRSGRFLSRCSAGGP